MKIRAAGRIFNLEQPPLSIGITLNFDGQQPNHFGAQRAHAQPMRSGDFIGDTRQGGSCNAPEIYLNPHCNGTHTESISHVVNELIMPHEAIGQPLMLAQLITLQPHSPKDNRENYKPTLKESDQVISKKSLTEVLINLHKEVKALIIRTKPNNIEKRFWIYGQDLEPPFFTHQAMQWITKQATLKHLLVDFPSVDKFHDDGLLSNHRIFWGINSESHQLTADQHTNKTITEMIYVPDEISDGYYLLNLQTPKWCLSVVPSHPVLYVSNK